MAARKRKKPAPTARELLWDSRKLLAEILLGCDPDAELYVEVNDLVVDCQEDIAKGDPRPEWLHALEEFADELEDDFGDETDVSPAIVDWDAFLAGHPELTAAPVRSYLAPLQFTDDEVLEAFVKACERRNQDRPEFARRHPGAWAAIVVQEMHGYQLPLKPGDPVPQPADAIRVGQALGRLARAGRIKLVSKSYESRRYVQVGEVRDA